MTLHIDITDWSILESDWLYSSQPKMEKLYTVSRTRPGVDCDSDHELLSAKFRLSLKKVGKTIRPFRYDLNQIPYDYTVEMMNRFKWLDLVDRMPEELWTERTMDFYNIVYKSVTKTIPKKKKSKKSKWLSKKVFHTVRGVLKARILKWFAILFSSGPHFVRTPHYDPSILGGPDL